MKISGDTLDRIRESFADFQQFVCAYVSEVALTGARLQPIFSPPRLADAHHFWSEDVDRLTTYSLNQGKPDHYKQAGHLAYWLRRQAPVIDYEEATAATPELTPDKEAFYRDVLFDFGSEYLAFDLGYLICFHHETGKLVSGTYPEGFALDRNYIHTVCCFLKEKNVSPHAITLVYKSLLYKRFVQFET